MLSAAGTKVGVDALAAQLNGCGPVVSRAPLSRLASVIALLVDALGEGPPDAPAPWRAAVRSRLDARALAALEPFATSRPADVPPCVLPVLEDSGHGLEEALERIAATAPGELAPLAEAGGPWQAVARRPRAWTAAYVRALGRADEGLEEVWSAASTLVAREVDRLESAIAQGVPALLTAEIVAPSAWRLEGRRAEAGRRPVLVPMLAGPHGVYAHFSGPVLLGVAYPVPRSWTLLDDAPPAPPALEALVGARRTHLLQLLDGPRTAGQLAIAMHLGPAGVTRHLDVLERAGLIAREPRGREVHVRRTQRGTALLAMYDAHRPAHRRFPDPRNVCEALARPVRVREQQF